MKKLIKKVLYYFYIQRMKRHFWQLTYLQVKHGIEADVASRNAGDALAEYNSSFYPKTQSR